MIQDYTQIDNPFDNQLSRGGSLNIATAPTAEQISKQGSSSTSVSTEGGGSEGSPSSGGVVAGGGSSSGGSVERTAVTSAGSTSDIWTNSFVRSVNWIPKTAGFTINGPTGYAEFSNVYISGDIHSLTGTIGGFDIGANYVRDVANSFGLSSVVTIADDVRFWAGATFANKATAPFRVTEGGVVTATSGAIGGWTLSATTLIGGNVILSSLGDITVGTGNDVARLSSTDATYRSWIGHAVAASAPFSVTKTGVLYSILGTIGGWTIAGTTLSSANIILDSANSKLESTNYVSGVNGAGFHIDPNLLEVGNIAARGVFRSATFQKDTVSTVGGNLLVMDGDVLAADMSALDSATVTISGATTFAVLDILRIKDGVNDEWMRVTDISSAPIYVVERDKAGDYAVDTNPAWTSGATVVNYGGYGRGGVYMTASESNAPYISIFDHAGDPWTTTTTRARLGNLNGYLGYTTDTYGIAIGESTKYLKYDPINGLSIRGNITVGSDNYIKGGQTDFATGDGFFLGYNAGDYKMSIGDANNYVTWDGTYLRMKGSFDVGDGGVINNASYTVATLPVSPTSLGYNNPSGID